MATQPATAPHLATDEEAFLELMLSDPDLLEAQFAAITAEDGTGQQPPEESLALKDVPGRGGPAVLRGSTSAVRLPARVGEATLRRRNRQRSPPQP
ncbi:MAG: hypothetical protein M3Y49_18915 [Actinomycetota bacterium]|nr:hypothetical protein [Actinomycetota bacterium]